MVSLRAIGFTLGIPGIPRRMIKSTTFPLNLKNSLVHRNGTQQPHGTTAAALRLVFCDSHGGASAVRAYSVPCSAGDPTMTTIPRPTQKNQTHIVVVPHHVVLYIRTPVFPFQLMTPPGRNEHQLHSVPRVQWMLLFIVGQQSASVTGHGSRECCTLLYTAVHPTNLSIINKDTYVRTKRKLQTGS